MSRVAPRMALIFALLPSLAGCAGLAALDDGICDAPTWQCVTSTPVYSERAAVDPPARPSSEDAATEALDQRMLSLIAADRRQRVEKAYGMALYPPAAGVQFPAGYVQRYRHLAEVAEALDGGLLAPVVTADPASARIYERKWRHAHQTLYLGGQIEGTKEFRFSGVQAVRSEISLHSIAAEPLALRLSCEGAAELHGSGPLRQMKQQQALALNFAARSGEQYRLVPAPGTDRCTIDLPGGKPARIVLLRDDGSDGAFAGIDGRYDVCASPSGPLDRLEQAFHADRWLSQTCVLRGGQMKLLSSPNDGFNAKVEALLGRKLSDRFIAAGEPMAPLDFSRAPKLSLIYVSYLDIKADFSGMIFARLLRHHAKRGVPIRILVTALLQRDKDRAMLEQLAADHPNIQLQEFSWRAPTGAAYDELAAQIHRAHHIKLLAVLSPQPGRSRAILGGRNIHDGFLYHEPLDLSRYPQLHTYQRAGGLTLNYYSNYRDFDVAISDENAVRTMAAHLSTIWHRDFETNVAQPFSVQRQGKGKPRAGMRHFISVPYADGGALQQYYVELIDAAEHSIEIANPYLNPPPEIEAALRRALERGVKVTIVARIDLHGDLGGEILTELNRMFVKKHADRIAIFGYREPDVVLHSKLLMIDERLSLVSSVNFNHRSFLHDSENGIAVLDRAAYRRIRKIFDAYRAGSVALDADVQIGPFYRLLLGNSLLREAL